MLKEGFCSSGGGGGGKGDRKRGRIEILEGEMGGKTGERERNVD